MHSEKEHWFDILEKIYTETNGLESGVDCFNLCDGRCCPRATVDHHTGFVIFLPFEPDYIAQILNMNLVDLERKWHIEKKEVKSLDGNLMYISWTRDCPYLKGGLCGIYKSRPFDCISFPVIPVLENGDLRFELGKKCPLFFETSISFQGNISEVWMKLRSELPDAWWDIVKSLVISNDVLTFKSDTN